MAETGISIALTPFRNLSTEADTEYFASGFTDELAMELVRFPVFRVLAGQSVMALMASGHSIEDVASDWGLNYIINGSVRHDSSAFRITVQLVRADDLEVVWAERFDCPLAEMFSVQDEIAATIASKLAVHLDETRLGRARRRSDSDLASYDLYLRGMDYLKRGTLEGDEESRPFFQKALQIDSHYARAYAGLSLSHFNEWTCQAWHLWDESEKNAFNYAAKAAELDDSDAMVHAILGRVHRFRGEHEQADNHVARAMSLTPNDAYVLIQIAVSKFFNGEWEQSAELARKAIRLNPLHGDWYHGVVGWNLFMLNAYDESYSLLQKAGGHIVNFGAYRAACCAVLGDTEGAREEYEGFIQEYRRKISFGREPEPGEAIRWAIQVEPFRRQEDARRMPGILAEAGLVELDVETAVNSRERPAVRPADIVQSPGNRFLKNEGIWDISYDGAGAQLVELKGFHDIAFLLSRPGQSVHCLELSGGAQTAASAQEMLDDHARREYRERIEELQSDLDRAEADGNSIRATPLRRELEMVIDELSRATGLGGRSRRMIDSAERSRSAVTWRIRSAIKKIQAAHPRLGQHLSNSIRTGAFCAYIPETKAYWEV